MVEDLAMFEMPDNRNSSQFEVRFDRCLLGVAVDTKDQITEI
jgi:hypothetical protein